MSLDWLDELNQIREEDQAQQEASQALDLSSLQKSEQAQSIRLLAVSDAHNLLRKVNRVLLGNKGIIDIVDSSDKYDRVLSLVWQGPISAARPPAQNDPSDIFYIMVGAKAGKLVINGKAIKGTTPEALKAALVQAAKNPGRKSTKK